MKRLPYLVAFMVVVASAAFGAGEATNVAPLKLLSTEQIGNWQVVFGPKTPWTLEDGVYRGHENWVGYTSVLDDFTLDCDFFFDGKDQGGIGIRSDLTAEFPWRQGYELDIDWAGDRKHGHIHFPGNPKPYVGEVLFDVGKWNSVRIIAKGKSVSVFLDGKQALQFESAQFMKGHICLEGAEKGVRYRNIVLTKM